MENAWEERRNVTIFLESSKNIGAKDLNHVGRVGIAPKEEAAFQTQLRSTMDLRPFKETIDEMNENERGWKEDEDARGKIIGDG